MNRKARTELEERNAALIESFTEDLGRLYPETLPLPGYYFPDAEGRWKLLEGETDATQEELSGHLDAETRMGAGVWVESGDGHEGVRLHPVVVFLNPR